MCVCMYTHLYSYTDIYRLLVAPAVVDLCKDLQNSIAVYNFLEISFSGVIFSMLVSLLSKISDCIFGLHNSGLKKKRFHFHILFSSHNERMAELSSLNFQDGWSSLITRYFCYLENTNAHICTYTMVTFTNRTRAAHFTSLSPRGIIP